MAPAAQGSAPPKRDDDGIDVVDCEGVPDCEKPVLHEGEQVNEGERVGEGDGERVGEGEGQGGSYASVTLVIL
jgi:hypothetical protein